VLLGDALVRLRELEPSSVDAVVTDPPAGIGFMGKEWDTFPVRRRRGGSFGDGRERPALAGGQEHNPRSRDAFVGWLTAVMAEGRRVLRPGGHALVWAIPRTSHWTATAVEDAGFEVRDVVHHLFAQGFPKSLDVGAAVAAVEGEETARPWRGWGTGLKPAAEHWILARRPLADPNVASQAGDRDRGDERGRLPGGLLRQDEVPDRLQQGDWQRLRPGRVQQVVDGRRGSVPAWPLAGQPRAQPRRGLPVGGDAAGRGTAPPGRPLRGAQSVGRATLGDPSKNPAMTRNATQMASKRWSSGSASRAARWPSWTGRAGVASVAPELLGSRHGLGYHGADGDGGLAIESSEGGASRFYYVTKASACERNAGPAVRADQPAPHRQAG
jgi:hypothetical protein